MRGLFVNRVLRNLIRPWDRRPDANLIDAAQASGAFAPDQRAGVTVVELSGKEGDLCMNYGPGQVYLDDNGRPQVHPVAKSELEYSQEVQIKSEQKKSEQRDKRKNLMAQLHDDSMPKDSKWAIEFLKEIFPELI
jgi:hypothetical protein